MPTDIDSKLPNGGNQEGHKIEPQEKTIKSLTPAADAWLKKLENSTLTTQEKIDATKVLLRLWKIQDRNKALFAALGLGHNGVPLDKTEEFKLRKLK